jgi:two-component system sensor histidine kinase YesM
MFGRSLDVKTRLLVAFHIIALAPMLILGAGMFLYTRAILKTQALEHSDESSRLIRDAVDIALEQHVTQVNRLGTNLEFLDALETYRKGTEPERNQAFNTLYSGLVGLVVTNEHVVATEIIDSQGLVAYAKYRVSPADYRAVERYRRLVASPDRVVWEVRESNLLPASPLQGVGRRIVLLSVKLRNAFDGRVVGLLSVGLSSEGLISIIENSARRGIGEVFFLNKSGTTAAHYSPPGLERALGPDLSEDTYRAMVGGTSDRSEGSRRQVGFAARPEREDSSPLQLRRRIKMPNRDYLYSISTSRLNGWSVAYVANQAEVLRDTRATGWLVLACILLSVAFVVPSSMMVTRSITVPIATIVSAMDSIEVNDFKHKIDDKSPDEIGSLSGAFDRMNDRIRELITEVYEGRVRQKEAELTALQAQINPHFLYNTLDSINWMAYRAGHKEIRTMVTALSSLFRLSLNKGSDYYVLRHELEHVKNYIAIQTIRHNGRIRFSVHTDVDPDAYETLKILLQPLVENAVIHGIEPNGGVGTVEVGVHKNGDSIVMTVTDDGVGIAAQQELVSQSSEHGYGIHNLRERIRLSYGEEYGITVTGKTGGGATATVVIPALPSAAEGGL